jgi:hypothetical protein
VVGEDVWPRASHECVAHRRSVSTWGIAGYAAASGAALNRKMPRDMALSVTGPHARKDCKTVDAHHLTLALSAAIGRDCRRSGGWEPLRVHWTRRK